MNQINVQQGKCRRDGICVAVCPRGIIELKEGAPVPTLVAGLEELCIKCGHCVAICPHAALSLDEMKPEDCPPVRREAALGSEQVGYFLRSRRSIRVYRDQAVESDKLAGLIEMAHYAPTATNSQQLQWLVINSKEKLYSLAGIIIDMFRHLIREGHPMAKAYRLELFVAAWERGKDPVLRGAPALVITHAPKGYTLAQVDGTIALTFLDLAAPASGLGSCWAGLFMMAAAQSPPLQEALALPSGHVCCGAMMVGYPTYDYHRLPLRKEVTLRWQE